MVWMNEWEIEEAADRYRNHPVLGPATKTLLSLVEVVNRNSDGWPYWRLPSGAAAQVMAMIERDGTARYRFDETRADATAEELRRAYAPLKAFRTKTGLQFPLHEPEVGGAAIRMFDAGDNTPARDDVAVKPVKRRPRATRAAPISLGLFDGPDMHGSA